MQNAELKNIGSMVFFCEKLLRGYYGRIERAKGFIKVGEIRIRFDLVGRYYSLVGVEKTEQSEVVFIGKHLARATLRHDLGVWQSKKFKRMKKEALESR